MGSIDVFDRQDPKSQNILLEDLLSSGLGEYTLPKDLPDDQMDEMTQRLNDSAIEAIYHINTMESYIYTMTILENHNSLSTEDVKQAFSKLGTFFLNLFKRIVLWFKKVGLYIRAHLSKFIIPYLERNLRIVQSRYSVLTSEQTKEIDKSFENKKFSSSNSVVAIVEEFNNFFLSIKSGKIDLLYANSPEMDLKVIKDKKFSIILVLKYWAESYNTSYIKKIVNFLTVIGEIKSAPSLRQLSEIKKENKTLGYNDVTSLATAIMRNGIAASHEILTQFSNLYRFCKMVSKYSKDD